MVLLLDKPIPLDLPTTAEPSSTDTDASFDWLDALYTAHHRQAMGLAAGIVQDHAEAEDVVHEAFLSAWRARAQFDPNRGSLRAWFLTLVRNRAIDVLRARRLRSTEPLDILNAPAADDDPVATVLAHLDQGWVGAALLQLPGEQRMVVELAYFHGLTHTEIATRLDLPLGTVKSRTRLALDRLRLLLKTRD
ncbi:MAG TPA: sigma-70 family RNA polymerase sigma factor [Chloroflexota bacterium]